MECFAQHFGTDGVKPKATCLVLIRERKILMYCDRCRGAIKDHMGRVVGPSANSTFITVYEEVVED